MLNIAHYSVQFSSVTQSCPTLCKPMNCSMPGLPVHHQLPEFIQTHVHQWYYPAISSSVVPFSSCPQSLPASGSFTMSQLFTWGGQNTGVSSSASVLPMNTQDWSPLGWTGWISLQSKGLSRVFFNTIVQKHQFFGTQLSSQSNSYIHTWPVREMQIKTTMRYHFIPVRMSMSKKSKNNKCWRECGAKGTLLHCWWGCKLIYPLWKKKLEIKQQCHDVLSHFSHVQLCVTLWVIAS